MIKMLIASSCNIWGKELIDPYIKHLASDWVLTFGSRDQEIVWDSSRNPFSLFQTIVKCDPIYAWDLILEVVEQDASGSSLELLASGPIEELLTLHGQILFDYIKADLLENRRLQGIFKSVRKSGIPDGVWRKLQAILQPSND